jgi:hypothetical protein
MRRGRPSCAALLAQAVALWATCVPPSTVGSGARFRCPPAPLRAVRWGGAAVSSGLLARRSITLRGGNEQGRGGDDDEMGDDDDTEGAKYVPGLMQQEVGVLC